MRTLTRIALVFVLSFSPILVYGATDRTQSVIDAVDATLKTLRSTAVEEMEQMSVTFRGIRLERVQDFAYPITWSVLPSTKGGNLEGNLPRESLIARKFTGAVTKILKYPTSQDMYGMTTIGVPWSTFHHTVFPTISSDYETIQLTPLRSSSPLDSWKETSIVFVMSWPLGSPNLHGPERTLAEVKAQLLNPLTASDGSYQKNYQYRDVMNLKTETGSLFGYPAMIATFTIEYKGKILNLKHVISIKNDYMTYTTTPEMLEKTEHAMLAVMKSITFREQSTQQAPSIATPVKKDRKTLLKERLEERRKKRARAR